MLECFFVYPVRGIEQGSAPQRTKNSPVDCFLARGRFPRVSPEPLQLMLEWFFVYPVRGIEPDGAQVLLCAIMERCVFGCILDMKIPPELFSLSTLGVAYQRSTGLQSWQSTTVEII